MHDTSTPTDTIRPVPNWDELVPNIFRDSRFRKSKNNRRRWLVEVNGTRAGIVVALRPADYDNHALNKEDLDKLLQLKQKGSFDAAFVVRASVGENFASAYIGHRNADALHQDLKVVRFRTGPHGDYWLLRGDFSPLDADPVMPDWL